MDVNKKNIEKLKSFAVIDTNVFISAMRNKFLDKNSIDSAVMQINDLIEKGNIIPLFDERILSEYYSVLNYSKFGFGEIPDIIENQMNLILSKGIFVNNIKELNEYFKDKTDIPFYEVMMDTQELDSSLVTGNIGHYPAGCPVTPRQMINQMDYIEKMFKPFIDSVDYDEIVKNKIIEMTKSNKYYLGDKLPKEFIEKIEERKLSEREHIDLEDYLER